MGELRASQDLRATRAYRERAPAISQPQPAFVLSLETPRPASAANRQPAMVAG